MLYDYSISLFPKWILSPIVTQAFSSKTKNPEAKIIGPQATVAVPVGSSLL